MSASKHLELTDQLKSVISSTARFVLSQSEYQVRSTIITKTKFINSVRELGALENVTNLKYASIFYEVNLLLQDIYGFKLIGVRSKKTKAKNISGDSQENTSANNLPPLDLEFKAERFILISVLPVPGPIASYAIQNARTLYLAQDCNNYNPDPHLSVSDFSTSQQLIFHGIMATVLCIIFFSKNNCLEQELLAALSKFGIPIDGNNINILNIKIEDILAQMVRLEYIQTNIPAAQSSSVTPIQESVFYSIDRRTQLEFPPEALLNMCKEFLGLYDSALESLSAYIGLSIGDSYS